MARRSSTPANPTDDHASNPTPGNANDPGGQDTGAPQGNGAPDTQSTGDSVPPKQRRKRGPNKPKPGTFTVETKARLSQEEIIKLLTSHAVTQLGGDVASRMVLQVSIEGTPHSLGEVLPPGATLQFATLPADESP